MNRPRIRPHRVAALFDRRYRLRQLRNDPGSWRYRIAGYSGQTRADIVSDMTATAWPDTSDPHSFNAGLSLAIQDTSYDDIVLLAARACDTPMAAIVLVNDHSLESLAAFGLDFQDVPSGATFCAQAILTPDDLTVVPDAHDDARFMDSPLVLEGPQIRFYAGVPLVDAEGAALGMLCVADTQARNLEASQREILEALARQVVRVLALHQQQAELERVNARLAWRSITDGLTGVMNRRAFEERLEAEVQRAQRYSVPLSLLMIDVDDFKRYNDTFGHPSGDLILRRLAALLQKRARQTDMVARYGGEEFTVIMPETSLPDALRLAQRYREAIAAVPWPRCPVTVSIGASSLAKGCQARAGLIEAADQALYQAKRRGKNRIVSAVSSALKHDP